MTTRFPFPKGNTHTSGICKSLCSGLIMPPIDVSLWFIGTIFWCTAFVTNPKTNDNYSTNALIIFCVLSLVPHVLITRGLIPDCKKDNNRLKIITWWIIFIIGWFWFSSGLFIAMSIAIRYPKRFMFWFGIILLFQLVLFNLLQHLIQHSLIINWNRRHINLYSKPFDRFDSFKLHTTDMVIKSAKLESKLLWFCDITLWYINHFLDTDLFRIFQVF